SGLSANTTYNIYAYMNSGTMTLEASTTARATQSGTGIEIKSGDSTRSIVGKARTNGSTAWVDSTTQRFVISYFNRRPIGLVNWYRANRTVTGVTFVEINSEIRCEFLTWADEAIRCYGNVVAFPDAVLYSAAYTMFSFDGSATFEEAAS